MNEELNLQAAGKELITIDIKYFTYDIDNISQTLEQYQNCDWIDLRAAKEVSIKANEFALIPLGVAMKLPDGYEAHVAARSSTFKNFGIIQTNAVAVIDNSYCGDNDEWIFAAYALRDTVIHVNDRICQFRIMKKQPYVQFNTVEKLEGPDRGGFGSTGIN